jgi:hypothetical protein
MENPTIKVCRSRADEEQIVPLQLRETSHAGRLSAAPAPEHQGLLPISIICPHFDHDVNDQTVVRFAAVEEAVTMRLLLIQGEMASSECCAHQEWPRIFDVGLMDSLSACTFTNHYRKSDTTRVSPQVSSCRRKIPKSDIARSSI